MTNQNRGELKRLAREYLMGNYPTAILAMLAAAILPPLVLSLFAQNPDHPVSLATAIYIAASLIVLILGRLLSINCSHIHLLLARRQDAGMADLIWVFRNRPDQFILGTLPILLMEAVPAIFAGIAVYTVAKMPETIVRYALYTAILSALCIANLAISYTYSLTYLLYIDHTDYSVREGLTRSRELMRGKKWRFFILQLSFAGMALLGICSLGIGLLWILPYKAQTNINFYLDVTGQLYKGQESGSLTGQHINATISD